MSVLKSCALCGGSGSRFASPCPGCSGAGQIVVLEPAAPCALCSGSGSRFASPCQGCGGGGWGNRIYPQSPTVIFPNGQPLPYDLPYPGNVTIETKTDGRGNTVHTERRSPVVNIKSQNFEYRGGVEGFFVIALIQGLAESWKRQSNFSPEERFQFEQEQRNRNATIIDSLKTTGIIFLGLMLALVSCMSICGMIFMIALFFSR